MRLGLVRYINAHPLDFGFRRSGSPADPDQAANTAADPLTWVEDVPSRLVQRLLAGELDAALISSVECLRQAARLAWCPTVGVCTTRETHSILYIRRGPAAPAGRPVRRVYVDEGSRSSVALLQVLYFLENGTLPEIEVRAPAEIPGLLDRDDAGLLIGDNALRFAMSGPTDFHVVDLASWWTESQGLPFIFALWAYPRTRPVPDAVFEESLAAGEGALDEIVRTVAQREYPDARRYLSEILHYRVTPADLRGLERFAELLRVSGLL